MIRKPQVAGTFYPGSKKELEESVKNYIGKHSPTPAAGIMVPHAGYLYSGKTAGLTYREIQIPETVIIIGPNHTGRGKPVSIMGEGRWEIPGAEIEIDLEIAGKLISESRFAENDREAHVGGFPRGEHCLEVQLPFLNFLNPDVTIVPVVMGVKERKYIDDLADAVVSVIKESNKEILIIASSDMSHFISEKEAEKKDNLAIKNILDLNYRGLLETVEQNFISMCGVAAAAVMVKASVGLGAKKAKLINYTTSAEVTGDSSEVVGYAGIKVK